jgi:hypothetical protein
MKIEPTTVTVEETTPLTYNLTILNSDMENVFSKNFFSLGPNLQIELIKSNTNKTTVYGPDFSDPITGAYHIQGNFPNGDYSLVVQLVAVGSEMPKVDAIDEFRGRIIS